MPTLSQRLFRSVEATESRIEKLGIILVDGFHLLALFAIGGTIVWGAFHVFLGMVSRGEATIDDILLLFIYLELGAMVGIYFKTVRMPVRYLVYIGITALVRLLLGSINHKHESDWTTLITTGSILILALSVLAIRYGSSRFPSDREQRDGVDVL